MTMNAKTYPLAALAAAILAAGVAPAAVAVEFAVGAVQATAHGAVTFGTSIRTEDPHPDAFGLNQGKVVGRTDGRSGNYNTLNFPEAGDAVSTVLKAVADVDLNYGNVGLFARAKAWHDFELDDGDRPYGNPLNRFQPGVPLADDGLDREARFSGAQFLDVYVHGKSRLGDRPLEGRLGRQRLFWGNAQLIQGGINAINPIDLAAMQRPGALPSEFVMPSGMLFGKIGLTDRLEAQAFAQYEFRHTELAACGSFMVQPDWAVEGCPGKNILNNAGVSDFEAFNDTGAVITLPSGAKVPKYGTYLHRAPTHEARDGGQYGLALQYDASGIATKFGLYLMNIHSRRPGVGVVNADFNAGVSATPGLAGTLSRLRGTDGQGTGGVQYYTAYPEDTRLLGLGFNTTLAAGQVYGELSWRDHQLINLNTSDLIDAFVTRNPNALLNRNRGLLTSVGSGQVYEGFDYFQVGHAMLGAMHKRERVLGAASLALTGEVGGSHVRELPPTSEARYGRSDAWGTGPVAGVACKDTVAGKTCRDDGYVTANAWGYRVKAALEYPGVVNGLTLKPSLSWAQDVDGYSYDLSFQEGRQMVTAGLEAQYRKMYTAAITWAGQSDGDYNILRDRDLLTLVLGVRF